MEAACSSETSVDFKCTTRHDILEDKTPHNNYCENLKAYVIEISFKNQNGKLFCRK
jgi:hypothetical protein